MTSVPSSGSRSPKQVILCTFDSLPIAVGESELWPNFLRLSSLGIRFQRASVGHLTATSVVSETVIETGLFPKHLPWQDQWIRDAKGQLGSRGKFHVTRDLSSTQMHQLLEPTLPLSLRTRVTGKLLGGMREENSLEGTINALSTPEKWSFLSLHFRGLTADGADRVLGKIQGVLEFNSLLRNAVLVVTATHGEAPTLTRGDPKLLSELLKPSVTTVSLHDSFLRFWTPNANPVHTARVAASVRSLPGVIQVLTKKNAGSGYHYVRASQAKDLSESTALWLSNDAQTLAETMASASSADVIAFLQEGTTYASSAEVSGASPSAQRIPLVILSPNLRGGGVVSEKPVRLVDINPIVARLLGLGEELTLDGSSAAIEPYVAGE